MKSNASDEYDATKSPKEDETAADKVVDRAQKFMGVDGGQDEDLDAPYQNAPDEDESDVPKGDKIIKNRKTGEETRVENTGDKY
ncbi:hypothetical protein [Planomicrobium sp. CPCC 101079]|uniref:hypothetical protein n=1 Tax=Planomicrobium sp. CPCC 101079 TaxID=2599618 RepID=UPI0011B7D752|nr:hypothetical protein [Planomicrobium sp. CPCC 101079]TWT01482.1 hypothetical protein FQV28_15520 [Planomicrobium sp. CPCC 101079]